MKKNVTVKINMKGVNKKLEKIAKKNIHLLMYPQNTAKANYCIRHPKHGILLKIPCLSQQTRTHYTASQRRIYLSAIIKSNAIIVRM